MADEAVVRIVLQAPSQSTTVSAGILQTIDNPLSKLDPAERVAGWERERIAAHSALMVDEWRKGYERTNVIPQEFKSLKQELGVEHSADLFTRKEKDFEKANKYTETPLKEHDWGQEVTKRLAIEAQAAKIVAQRHVEANEAHAKRQEELDLLAVKVELESTQKQQLLIETRAKRQEELDLLATKIELESLKKQQITTDNRAKRQEELDLLAVKVELESARKQEAAAETHIKRQEELDLLAVKVELESAEKQNRITEAQNKRREELDLLAVKIELQSAQKRQAVIETHIKRQDELDLLAVRAQLKVAQMQEKRQQEIDTATDEFVSQLKLRQEVALDDLSRNAGYKEQKEDEQARQLTEGAEDRKAVALYDIEAKKAREREEENARAQIESERVAQRIRDARQRAARRRDQERQEESDALMEGLNRDPVYRARQQLDREEGQGEVRQEYQKQYVQRNPGQPIPGLPVPEPEQERRQRLSEPRLRRIATGAEATANFAVSDSDPGKNIGDIGEAVSGVGLEIAKIHPITGAIVAGIGMSVKAVGALTAQLNRVADRYGEYDPNIATAQALAEVRNTLSDLRRSGEVSAEMTKYIAVQSDLQQKFENIKIELLNKLIPDVTRIIELLELILPTQGTTRTILDALYSTNLVPQLLTELINLIKGQKEEEPIQDPTTQLFDKKFNMLQVEGGWVP